MTPQQLAGAIADFYAEDPKRWTQDFTARDAKGAPVEALDESATSWCMSGAVDKIFGKTAYKTYESWNDMRRRHFGGSVIRFNDAPGRTVAQVIDRLREFASQSTSEGKQ